jgi:cyclic pyranopterin phosphate synthase
MIDPFGRSVSYLRLSVTDRCDLRCVYCMPEHMEFLPKSDVLSLEELQRLSGAFIDLGIKKIRLTGGEPLVRRDVMTLIRALGNRVKEGTLDEVTLTTNGTQLERFASDLAEAGVKRINVSMDSLTPDLFRQVTRGGDLHQVIEGIDRALDSGIAVKINTVALKGVNDHEYIRLVEWCMDRGIDVCFIETMPMGDVDGRLDRYLPLGIVEEILGGKWTLQPSDYYTGGPARYSEIRGTGMRVGFITPMTHNFCEGCNRIRVTCTGTLFMCLGQDDAVDLREPLRQSKQDHLVRAAILDAIAHKPKGHDFMIDQDHQGPSVSRTMSMTGG